MKRMALFICCTMLGGCVHANQARIPEETLSTPAAAKEKRELSASLVERSIVKGKTTKKEILAVLGSPNSVEPNRQQLSKELLKGIKAPLPPVARTREFWRYWSIPDGAEKAQDVFNLMVFFDDDEIAVDYLTGVTHLSAQ